MSAFDSVWTDKTKEAGLILFRHVYQQLVNIGAHPIIFYGTLLGCCRDGKLIPWDGDFDIYLPKEYQTKLPDFGPEYKTYPHGNCNAKVYSKNGLHIGKGFKWPWVDIDFYEERKGRVHFLGISGSTYYGCLRPEVFPLGSKRFEGMYVNVPYYPEIHLDRIYPNWREIYQSAKIDHKTASLNPEIIEIPIND